MDNVSGGSVHQVSRLLRFGESGEYLLDVERKIVFIYGPRPRVPVDLTSSEASVLTVLALNSVDEYAEPWVSRETIVSKAGVADTSVGNHIGALRGVFGGEKAFPNAWGSGWRIHPPACWYEEEDFREMISRQPETVGTQTDNELAEKTYLAYRTIRAALVQSPELIAHLEARYKCKTIQLCGRSFAATAIWTNDHKIVTPNDILGTLHQEPIPPVPLEESTTLSHLEYVRAREFIKTEYTKGPIKHEGKMYRTTRIEEGEPPKIHGAYGLYYDSILTQYGIEWELNKALLTRGLNRIDSLSELGTLPLREAVEALGDPRYHGAGRCAALATSTLLVFKHPDHDGFCCLIRRRSPYVGVSRLMLHVIPAGMFEARNYGPWSVENNVWRELLEEVYNDKEELGSEHPDPVSDQRVRLKVPVNLLIEMIDKGLAEFSVTGICCDLISLRHEVCTILRDVSFFKARAMELNWEWELATWATLEGAKLEVPLDKIDTAVELAANSDGVTPTGAACIAFGRAWLHEMHRL